MALNKKDVAPVRAASRSDVAATLASLKRFTKGSAWVGKTNRYTRNAAKAVTREVKSGKIKSPRQLSQYVAASGLLHCSDGWSYLGKAVHALLRGDPHRCRHFAYYAELRAAIGLLAAEGIGVFQNRHVFIDSSQSASPLHGGTGTHEFTWDCLEFWSGLPKSGALFLSLIRTKGKTLDEWLQPVRGSTAFKPQARQWLLQWGMDIKMTADDRRARNESSYRPDGLPDSWRIQAPDSLDFARHLWTALEPSSNSRFELVDQHILRASVESVYRGRHGDPKADPAKFKGFATTIVAGQGFDDAVSEQTIQFLCRETKPDSLRIMELARISPTVRDTSHLAIVSRAALLLRIASGSVANLVQAAGFTGEALSFWWSGLGNSRGLWDGDRMSDTLTDLWADIPATLDDVNSFQRKYAEADQTFYLLGTELGKAIPGLGSCERVAAWGLTA